MTISGMEAERSQVSENILTLTLEIICLLTGERCAVVKMAAIEGLLQGLYPPLSGEQSPITAPPPSLDPTINNQQKILEVINQVIRLLTGERRSQSDILQDSDCLKGHKRLSTAAMMEEEPTDGSWERHPAERGLLPTASQNSALEEHEHSRLDQGGHIKEEETPVSCDQRLAEEMGMMVTIKEEDVSTVTDPELGLIHIRSISEETLSLSLDCKAEDDNITDDSSKEGTTAANLHPRAPPADRSPDPVTPGGSSLDRLASVRAHAITVCPVCGKCFTSKTAYNNHRRLHSENRPYCCSECGKRFKQKTHLVTHQECHAREQSLSCSECGKRFESKARFALHQRYHAGEKIYTCPECGKEYLSKSKLNRHQKQHTAEKPFACTECEYRGWFHSDLVLHFRTHTGERPFVCPECGKSFRRKFLLHRHQSKKH